jgi:hypothetical protein
MREAGAGWGPRGGGGYNEINGNKRKGFTMKGAHRTARYLVVAERVTFCLLPFLP